jgi:hypothetical protein
MTAYMTIPIVMMHHTQRTHRTSRMYSYGEYKAEDQDKMLFDLDKKVAEVYASCVGANEANIP